MSGSPSRSNPFLLDQTAIHPKSQPLVHPLPPRPRPRPPPPPEPVQPAPLPGTPAPSPPPSPGQKAKKQQFQTDPTRPFLFPYSRNTNGTPASLVPFAIAEADKLYHRHAYVSLGLYQIWEAREECIREERGLGRKGLIGFEPNNEWDDVDDEAALEAMRLDWHFEEEEAENETRGDKAGAELAQQNRMVARRLHRVHVIYVSQAFRSLLSLEINPADHAELCHSSAETPACYSHWTWSSSSRFPEWCTPGCDLAY